MHAAIWTIHESFAPSSARAWLGFGDNVTLNPGPEEMALRNMIFLFTGFGAKAAADAAVDVDGHNPLVLVGIVALGGAGGDQTALDRGLGCFGQRKREHPGESAGNASEGAASGNRFAHGTSDGACGTWHSVHLDDPL